MLNRFARYYTKQGLTDKDVVEVVISAMNEHLKNMILKQGLILCIASF